MRKSLLRFLIASIAAAVPALAYAKYNASPDLIKVCDTVKELGCNSDLGSLIQKLIDYGSTAYIGILTGSIIFYGLRLLIGADTDNASTETKQAFEYAILGALIILGAQILASSFVRPGAIVNVSGVSLFLESKAFTFIKALIGGALILNISIQGTMMIISSDEGGVSSARKKFLYGIIGCAITVLAGPIIIALNGGNSSGLGTEVAGIGSYLIAIFGVLAVIGIIVGGLMHVVSFDEGLKEKARKTIVGSIIALLVVITSGALVKLFIFS